MATKKTDFNTTAVDGIVATSAGDQSSVAQVIFRRTFDTQPALPSAMNVMPFTTVMMDKRAPGINSLALSGPTAKLEWLAEIMVRSGVVAEVARAMMQHDLVAKVNERLLRANARFKQGTVLMSHPALYGAMLEICGASTNRDDPKRVTARVLTELFARIYSSFNVIMQYRTVYVQEAFDRPLATTSDLIKGAYTAQITEVLETLKLGVAIKEKEFAPAVIETLVGPLLLQGANRLLASERYNRWMNDAARLTSAYLRNADDPALENLRDNGNLQVLATNASWAFSAMADARFRVPAASPVHEHSDLLEHAALRLRELRRYESLSMDKFVNMYSFYQARTAKGRTAGLYVTRNLEMTAHSKAIVLQGDSGVYVPMNSYEIDPYMPMLNEFTNHAFGGQTPADSALAFLQFVATREIERDPSVEGGRIVGFNITEEELQMLACAKAQEIIISSPHDTTDIGAGVYFGVRPIKSCNYIGGAYYTGDTAYTTDPAEALILQGEDFEGNQKFPTKPQTYAEELFTGLLDGLNERLYNTATRSVVVKLPLADGTDATVDLSLYTLLTGLTDKPVMDNYIAVDVQAANIVQAYLSLASVAYQELLLSGDETDKLLAEQIATNVHNTIARFVEPVGFARFMRTINVRLMGTPEFKINRDKRAMVTNMVAQHNLAIRLAATMMLRMGLIPYGLHEDIVRMLTDAKAIERAATSQAFAKVISGRY